MLPTVPTGTLEPLLEAAGMSTESKGGQGGGSPHSEGARSTSAGREATPSRAP